MDSCRHSRLILLPKQRNRLRCRHCHLTIKADELPGRYGPECFEVNGRRRYDFEEVQGTGTERTQYRCEDCGALIDCD
jgi:hypothetical protein